MRRFGRLLTAITSLLAVLTLAQPTAFAASESGTLAWSTAPLVLRNGPGIAYDITGDIVADTQIKVLRCQRLWCVVDGPTGRGWTNKGDIVFGRTSAPFPFMMTGYPQGATVCFYQGANYSGGEFCIEPGRSYRDLALVGLDNAFSSVRVMGEGSADVCRDRFFQSYCERVTGDQPVLDEHLRQSLSSIRVH